MPRDLNAGVIISQHMPSGFTKAFAERLGRMGQLASKEAEDGDLIEKGKVYIAPGGKNLLVARREGKVIAQVEEKTPEDRYIPSVDKMLKSAARMYGARMIAVVLTGMGSDGKEGVVAVKDSGGYIIAESEKTSIVFGMPREAIATRKVDQVVNLEEISREILKFC
jgi:two-component system chemotaxis response regulator CheB